MSDEDDGEVENLFADGDGDEDDDNEEHQNPRAMRDLAVEGEENTFHAIRLRSSQQQQTTRQSTNGGAAGAVERDQLIPFQQPVQDPREMPVSYVVTDAVALYGNVSLWVLMYGQATRNIVSPVLCDAERGTL